MFSNLFREIDVDWGPVPSIRFITQKRIKGLHSKNNRVISIISFPPKRIVSVGSDNAIAVWNVEGGGYASEGFHYIIINESEGTIDHSNHIKWDDRSILFSVRDKNNDLNINILDVYSFRQQTKFKVNSFVHLKINEDLVVIVGNHPKRNKLQISLVSISKKKIISKICTLGNKIKRCGNCELILSKKNPFHFFFCYPEHPVHNERRIIMMDYRKEGVLKRFDFQNKMSQCSTIRSFLSQERKEVLVLNGIFLYDVESGKYVKRIIPTGKNPGRTSRGSFIGPDPRVINHACFIVNDKYILNSDQFGRINFYYTRLDYLLNTKNTATEDFRKVKTVARRGTAGCLELLSTTENSLEFAIGLSDGSITIMKIISSIPLGFDLSFEQEMTMKDEQDRVLFCLEYIDEVETIKLGFDGHEFCIYKSFLL